MSEKIIHSLTINTNDMPAVATARDLTVVGDNGAEFIINAFDNSGSFYNFKSQTFAAGFSNDNNLKVKIGGTSFRRKIFFPAASAKTYTILLIARSDKNTQGPSGKVAIVKTIYQAANSTVTLGMGTANSSNYAGTLSDSNVTSTASPIEAVCASVDIGWTVTNTSSDARGYGFWINPDVTVLENFDWNKAWYFETTETVDGAVASSSNTVVVDDTTDLVVGMELKYITGTTAPGALTYVTAIDIPTKTLTLSRNQALTDGHTMTFRAYGSGAIKKATGLDVSFGNFEVTSSALTKTVRTDPGGSTTINLNGTYGLTGGNVVTYKGAKVDNSAANAVTSVSASSSAGSIVVQRAQTLAVGTKLTFADAVTAKGSTQSMKIVGEPVIKKYPTSNRTIYLDLDKIISHGTAS